MEAQGLETFKMAVAALALSLSCVKAGAWNSGKPFRATKVVCQKLIGIALRLFIDRSFWVASYTFELRPKNAI